MRLLPVMCLAAAQGCVATSTGSPSSSSSSSSSGFTRQCTAPRACPGCPMAVDIEARANQGCARFHDGTMQCWGSDSDQDLGLGKAVFQSLPGPFVDGDGGVITNVTGMARGEYQTCALLDGGRVTCAGNDFFHGWGTWAPGGLDESPHHGTLLAVDGVQRLSAGLVALCYDFAGSAPTTCLGDDSSGQLGGNLPADFTQLLLVNNTGMLVTTDGVVLAWGDAEHGTLGEIVPPAEDGRLWRRTPAAIPGVAPSSRVAIGDEHACALNLSGHIQCWGRPHQALGNDNGTRLDDGTQVPSEVLGDDGMPFTRAVDVSAGSETTCAIRDDGTLWCWGSNNFGELGNSTMFLGSTVPVRVTEMDAWVHVAAFNYAVCALDACGDVWCWGRNDELQLGLPEDVGSGTPTRVTFAP